MKHTILVYETEAAFSSRTGERRREGYWGAYRAYTQALQAAGVMVGGAGLQLPPLGRGPAQTVHVTTLSVPGGDAHRATWRAFLGAQEGAGRKCSSG